jgi:hypothetical protein
MLRGLRGRLYITSRLVSFPHGPAWGRSVIYPPAPVFFVLLVFVVAFVGTIALYLLVTELYPWVNFFVCYLRLLLGWGCRRILSPGTLRRAKVYKTAYRL